LQCDSGRGREAFRSLSRSRSRPSKRCRCGDNRGPGLGWAISSSDRAKHVSRLGPCFAGGDVTELAKLDSGREHADAVTPIFPLDHVGLGAFADDEEALQFRGANTVLTVRGERQAMDTLSVSSILKSANAASGVLVRV
jgi:hypothetical protein